MAQTTTTYGLSGNAYIDGLLDVGGNQDSQKWAAPTTLTYSFPGFASNYGPGYRDGEPQNGFGVFTAGMQTVTIALLAEVSKVANLVFTPLGAGGLGETDTTHADLRFAFSNSAGVAYAYTPSTLPEGGDVWVNNTSTGANPPGQKENFTTASRGNYGFTALLHEIGHTMGLQHGHKEDPTSPAQFIPADRDSMEFSVMTYRGAPGGAVAYNNEEGGYAQSLMMLDIAALQHLYGANFNSNSGDTTYKWSPLSGQLFINGVGRGAPVANRVFETIWDGNGIDTYDFSDYSTPLTINLTPGLWSVLSDEQIVSLNGGTDGFINTLGDNVRARGNVFNALQFNGDARSLIEYAVGGSAGDTMVGNSANNWLQGKGGNDLLYYIGGFDWLYGDAGTDTASFALLGTNGAAPIWIDLEQSGTYQAWTRGVTLDAGTWTPVANLVQIEYLVGTAGGDYLKGNSASNWIQGGEGNDTLLYSAGAQDFLYGDGGTDTADFSPLDKPIWVDLAQAGTVQAFTRGATLDAGTWTAAAYLLSIENLTGTNFADYLRGTVGNNTILGGAGNDTLVYTGGLDTLNGGSDIDTAEFSPLSKPIWVDLAGTAWTRGADLNSGTWTLVAQLTSIENATGTGFGDYLQGTAAANALSGLGGDDTLVGLGGADVLTGGTGTDVFFYTNVADSGVTGATRDMVNDFDDIDGAAGDYFDLRGVDAVAGGSDDAFNFLANNGDTFNALGQLRWYTFGNTTWIEGNTTGDTAADFSIVLIGVKSMTAGDFAF